MQRKERFPPEPDTKPDMPRPKAVLNRHSVTAPKKHAVGRETAHPTVPREAAHSTVDRREMPTEPPPAPKRRGAQRPRKEEERTSVVRARRPVRSEAPAATVDEVVADLSRDPRRERDEDD